MLASQTQTTKNYLNILIDSTKKNKKKNKLIDINCSMFYSSVFYVCRLTCVTSRSTTEQQDRVHVTISDSFTAHSTDFFSYVVSVHCLFLHRRRCYFAFLSSCEWSNDWILDSAWYWNCMRVCIPCV